MSRIWRAVRSIEHSKLAEYLAEQRIHLEICPTSNVQTNLYGEYSDHPIDRLYKSGFSVGINTDARALANITLSGEYAKLIKEFDWKIDDFYKCNMNALNYAFIAEGERQELMNILNSGYKQYMN